MTDLTDQEKADARRYWLAGRCPCCGSENHSWPSSSGEEIEPELVAEGVVMCGRCIGNHHHTSPEGFLEKLLEAIVTG